MNSRPLTISVITVCRNSEATIDDTLQSVASQTYPAVDHVIVDGGSTDGTMTIVNRRRQRVSQVVSEPDRGIYDAMNKGIRMATGDVIGFINSDDFYAGTHVLAMVAEAFADPSIDACYGDVSMVAQNNLKRIVRYWRSSPFKPRMFATGWCPPHPTFFVRRSVYERLGVFDLTYKIAADVELMMRFLESHRIRSRYLPHVLVTYRMGGTTNKSIATILRQNREIWTALSKHDLKPPLLLFAAGKFLSRGRQFLSRPKGLDN